MTCFLKRLAVVALAVAVAAFLYVWAGLVPIAASTGHWQITTWFLHFAMRQSVETQSLDVKAPSLDDPSRILKGAGHYETGCAPCHGAPGDPPSPIPQEMTPHPPYLPPKISSWDPDELFWIVKHGIKYTGMPAWVALGREDEVWAVTAFLLTLPELSPEEYRQLAFGEMAPLASGEATGHTRLRRLDDPLGKALANCARCHGLDGLGRGSGAFPALAYQTEEYLYASLVAYAEGERHSGIMQPIAAGLSRETMRELAAYYADQEPGLGAEGADPGLVVRGEALARDGSPERGLPACVQCHGPIEHPRNDIFPRLAGQHADYLEQQLELFKHDLRGGTPYAHIMRSIAERLSKQEMRELAAYYASLDAATAD